MKEENRPICGCGNKCKRGSVVNGVVKGHYKQCSQCLKKKNKQGVVGNQGGKNSTNARKYYKKLKGALCERCGFIASNACQLDVHHIDGNHYNQESKNLMTLCSNCHRLEHFSLKQKKP